MFLNSQGCIISTGAVPPHSRQRCSAFAASSSSTALAKAQDLIIEGSARVALMTDVVKSELESFGTRVLVHCVSPF